MHVAPSWSYPFQDLHPAFDLRAQPRWLGWHVADESPVPVEVEHHGYPDDRASHSVRRGKADPFASGCSATDLEPRSSPSSVARAGGDNIAARLAGPAMVTGPYPQEKAKGST